MIIKNYTAKLGPHADDPASGPLPMFSAHVGMSYRDGQEFVAFTVQFFHDSTPVYIRDGDLIGEEGTPTCEDTAFRFFDWKNPLWKQILGTISRDKRTNYGQCWYTHAFTFTIGEDVMGIDYFGLRLKRGMFGFQCQDAGVCVLCQDVEQQMAFDTPYFILNPKDKAQDLIQIRQDRWMPLLVSAYSLGSAVERLGRPHFSQAIEKIRDWFRFMLGQRRDVADDRSTWDEVTTQRQLIKEMLYELWEKGPRRLLAFYSGMGYVFHTLGLADLAADVIYDVYSELHALAMWGTPHPPYPADMTKIANERDTSLRLFAVMLLLGLRTEKARLYITVDLNWQSLQEYHNSNTLRELLDIKSLMDLFFATQGRHYAPIRVPKPFALHWGRVRYHGKAKEARLDVVYKNDRQLSLTFTLCTKDNRYAITLVQASATGATTWLGQIILSCNAEDHQVRFVTESLTSNFHYVRDINAFKYILLAAACGYAQHVLGVTPKQMVFAADFFDHCAPYDLLLLQQFGWEAETCDLSKYKLATAEMFPYSGRAMTLPVVRVPSAEKGRSALVIYLLGIDGASVAIDPELYHKFITQLRNQSTWPITTTDGGKVLVDGLPRLMVDTTRFQQSFISAFPNAASCFNAGA